jgi:Fe2+ transport system protein FeoA
MLIIQYKKKLLHLGMTPDSVLSLILKENLAALHQELLDTL